MTQQPQRRVIKRYANRKLYDMSESCYVTHDEIAQLVERGEDIQIIDNRTKEDLTSATLTQILFDKERKTKRALPLDTLKNFFQSGGEFIQKHITHPVTNLRDEAERKFPKVFTKTRGADGEIHEDEVDVDPVEEDDLTGRTKPAEAVRELVTGTQAALEERFKEIKLRLGQFDINHDRICSLEQRVLALEAEVIDLRNQLQAN